MTGANDTPPATGDTPPEDPNAHVKPGLSDEEKAALAAEDDADDKVGAVAKGDETPAATTPQAAGETKPDDDGAGATPAKPAAPPEIPRGRASATELTTSHDIDPKATQERLTAIDTEITALDAKLESGDIEAKDYAIQSRTLSGEQGDLKADLREVGFVENANTQLASGDWNRSVDQFMQENSQFDEPIMSGALNAALNSLYTDDKNVGASHNWFLQTAARAVTERISPAKAALDAPPGTEGVVPLDKNAQAVADAAAAAKKAAAAKDGLPVTLGETPAAGAADVSAGEFAALDNLTGMELEAKLASMSTAQQDAYLRG